MPERYFMNNRKPIPELRNVLALEDVVIFSDPEIKTKPIEQLDNIIDYYHTTLETLAGTQIWDIVDSLNSAKSEKNKRQTSKSS